MSRADRQARAKAIGRIAYRRARDATIVGYIEIDSGRYFIREWRAGRFVIELHIASNHAPDPDDVSELRILHGGRTVFVIRWSEAGNFQVVTFKDGDWEDEMPSGAGK